MLLFLYAELPLLLYSELPLLLYTELPLLLHTELPLFLYTELPLFLYTELPTERRRAGDGRRLRSRGMHSSTTETPYLFLLLYYFPA